MANGRMYCKNDILCFFKLIKVTENIKKFLWLNNKKLATSDIRRH